MTERKPPPRKTGPAAKRTTAAKKPTGTRQTTVRSHARRTQSGRQTTVRQHTRTVSAWQQAGIAWAGAGASGLTTLGLILQFGFGVVGIVFLLLTMALSLLASLLTDKAVKPGRRMRSKTQKHRRRR